MPFLLAERYIFTALATATTSRSMLTTAQTLLSHAQNMVILQQPQPDTLCIQKFVLNALVKSCITKKFLQEQENRESDNMANYKNAGRHKKTLAKFVEEANIKHNYKYSYANTVYAGANIKLTVTCPEHGDFEIKAGYHLDGGGCKACNSTNKKQLRTIDKTASFVDKANTIHKNEYTYQYAQYTGREATLMITCSKHGNFEMTARRHLDGGKCKSCVRERRCLHHDEFIQRCVEKYGNTFDYAKTQYVKMQDEIVITCRKHGDFTLLAANHLVGSICPECSTIKKAESKQRAKQTKLNNITKWAHNLDTGKW